MVMQKIAFVTEVYQDSNFSTGGEKLNYILLKELKMLGYSIDLFSDKVKPLKSNIFDNILSLKDFEDAKNNYHYVLSENGIVPSDITYIHGHSYIFRAKYMSNKISHIFYKIISNKKHKKRLNEYLKTKVNLNLTKTVIVSSEILKQDMIDNYGIDPKNIVIISPPIEGHELLTKHENKVFTFGISAVGFERKGGYILLKAIKELKKSKINFKVIFIYPSKNIGVNLAKKIYNIEKYCEFIGIQEDMNKFYSSIDCLLMPSIIEPFGMVATEALSNGCPVITSTRCGAADYIQHKENGFLYDAKSPVKGLVNSMIEVMSIKDEEKVSIYNNCIKSVEDCNEKVFVQKYIELLK